MRANPFWVHGELSVELDLPWPLPNVGGTISLSWGGDDGSAPFGPLGLSHLDATLADHCDSAVKQARDHYELLAHRATPIAHRPSAVATARKRFALRALVANVLLRIELSRR
jgi:hypothetical protein